MGESKVKVSKEKKVQEEQKYSYDELNNIAHQLNEQNVQLYRKLQEANLDNMFKRLDYLFKVLDKPEFFENEFVDKCANEIVELMTIPEENKDEDSE